MHTNRRPSASLAATVLVGTCAAASRLLGFARDVLIASVFGTGFVADALLLGLRLPNLLRRTLAEGGGQGALVPWLMREKTAIGLEAARRSGGGLLVALVLFAVGSGLAVYVLRVPLMLGLAPGFVAQSETFDLASSCLALAFPMVGTAILSAFATAWLSVRGAYGLAGLSGLLVNGVLLLLLLGFERTGQADADAARLVALGMSAAGLAQAVLLVCVIVRQRDGPRLAWPVWNRIAAAGQGLVPSITVAAAPQLAFLVVLAAATRWPGWSSQLVYAERLVQLPFGFIAAGLALVALPDLTRLHLAQQKQDFDQRIMQALSLALALALPACTGLVCLAEPIILILFRHGAFSYSAALETANALKMLAFSLPLLAVARVLGQAFFAQHRYAPPVIASGAGVLAVLLLSHFAPDGAHLALVFATAMALECLVLAAFAAQKKLFLLRPSFFPPLLKLVACNLVLLGVLDRISASRVPVLYAPQAWGEAAGTLGLVIAGSLVLYALSLSFCRLWPVLLAKNWQTTLHDA